MLINHFVSVFHQLDRLCQCYILAICSFEITPLHWLESSIGGFFSSVGYHKYRHMPITNLYS
jgi:hypothetical protein